MKVTGFWRTSLVALAICASPGMSAKRKPTPPPIVLPSSSFQIVTSPLPQTAAEKFGDWAIYPVAKGAWATTKNASGSAFGVVCVGGCTAFFNLQTTCEQDAQYPALVNSSGGSFTVLLKCTISESRYLLTMTLNDTLINSLSIGGELGVAIPLEGGKFTVGRFSMTGGLRAASRALDIAKARGSVDDNKVLKDYSL